MMFLHILSTLLCMAVLATVTGEKQVVCYYSSTSHHRPSRGKFLPEDINPNLCTHIIFAFANILDGKYIRAAKPEDLTAGGKKGMYARTIALKDTNPKLKVLIAVGGWIVGSEPFSKIVVDEKSRKTFSRNAVRFLRQQGFDGLDIDWEFPGVRGSPPEDKERFTLFLKDLQSTFRQEAQRTGKDKLLLTLATAGGSYFIEKAYEEDKIIRYIDYLLVMTYNYHGSWNAFTGHHSSMRARSDETGGEREWNQEWTIDFWLETGVDPSKLILGVPTYGMSFTLTDPTRHGLRAPASGAGKKGKYTQEGGVLAYYEVCEAVDKDKWESVWVDQQSVPYAYHDDQWVGYDNVRSIAAKAKYIMDKGLGGAFIWSVEMDDFGGTCGEGPYPLLTTIYRILTSPRSRRPSQAYRRIGQQQKSTDRDLGVAGYHEDRYSRRLYVKNSHLLANQDARRGGHVTYADERSGSRQATDEDDWASDDEDTRYSIKDGTNYYDESEGYDNDYEKGIDDWGADKVWGERDHQDDKWSVRQSKKPQGRRGKAGVAALYKCMNQGVFADWDDCSVYNVCVRHLDQMYHFRMRCPAGLKFSAEEASCGYDDTCRV